jgi:cytochrome P450
VALAKKATSSCFFPDPRWRVDRKLMNPTFNLKILDSFFPIFNRKSQALVDNLTAKLDGSEFDVYVQIAKCTFNTVFGEWPLYVKRVFLFLF